MYISPTVGARGRCQLEGGAAVARAGVPLPRGGGGDGPLQGGISVLIQVEGVLRTKDEHFIINISCVNVSVQCLNCIYPRCQIVCRGRG